MNKYLELINEIKKAIETLDKEIESEKKEYASESKKESKLRDEIELLESLVEETEARINYLEFYQGKNVFLTYLKSWIVPKDSKDKVLWMVFVAGLLSCCAITFPVSPILGLGVIISPIALVLLGSLLGTKNILAYMKKYSIEKEYERMDDLNEKLTSKRNEINKLTYEQICLYNKTCDKVTRKEYLKQELERLYELMNVGVLKAVDENILNKSFDENPEVEMIRKRLNKNEFKEEE